MENFYTQDKKEIEPQKTISEIVLTTREKEAQRASGDDEEWGRREAHRVSATPFAIANYAYQSSLYSTMDGKPNTCYFLGSKNDQNFLDSSYYSGEWAPVYPDSREYGLRPAFYLNTNGNLSKEEQLFMGKYKNIFMEYGYFPKTNANDQQNAQFEDLFNGGKLKEGIKSLGIWYTTSGVSEFDQNFTPRYVSVFEINGERWVRAIENPYEEDRYVYPDGTKVGKRGSVRWFKDEPVIYKVFNPLNSGKAPYSLETEQIILSNMPFYPNIDDDGRTDFKNSTIRAYFNGIKTQGGDFTEIGSFKAESFNPNRAPIYEWTIPDWQTEIADFAFQGACHLKKITIPKTVTKIGENAFAGTSFNYISKTNTGDTILSIEPLNQQNIVSAESVEKLKNVFIGIDIGKFCVENADLKVLGILADKLFSSKDSIRYEFVEKLFENNLLIEFVERHNLKGFRQIQKIIPYNITKDDLVSFYTFAYNIGCFSTNPILNQKANEWLKEKIMPETKMYKDYKQKTVLPFSSMYENFKNWKLKGESFEFSDFLFGRKPESKEKIFDEIQRQEEWGKLLYKIYQEFSNPETELLEGGRFRDSKSGRLMFAVFHESVNAEGRTVSKRKDLIPTIDLFKTYFSYIKFYGIKTEEDKLIAKELGKWGGMNQDHFDKAQDMMEEFRSLKIPKNIVGKHIKEISTEIEDYKKQTEKLAFRGIKFAKEIIGKLTNNINKNFTYEWLEKNDPMNFCLGLYCNSCSNLSGVGYGILRSNFVHPDVQNLVIKNQNGRPVAKATIYINREECYGVFNTVQIANNMDDQKQHIYESFIEGVNKFAIEYNLQNPNKELKKISVGMNLNDLTDQIKKGCKPSKILKGIDFSNYGIDYQKYNGDWTIEQYVVWQSNSSNEQKGGMEK